MKLKSLFVLLIALSFSGLLKGQSPTVAMESGLHHLLFLGIDNTLHIAVEGANDADVELKMEGADVIKLKDGVFLVRVLDEGTQTAQVFHRGKLVREQVYTILLLPTPQPFIGKYTWSDETASKEALLAESKITLKGREGLISPHFKIVGFKMSVIIGGEVIEAKSLNENLTSEMRATLKKLEPGKRIYIEEVMAKGPEGISRKIGALTFKLEL